MIFFVVLFFVFAILINITWCKLLKDFSVLHKVTKKNISIITRKNIKLDENK